MDKKEYGGWIEKTVVNVNIVIAEIYLMLNDIKMAQKYLNKCPQAETILAYLCKAEIAHRNNDEKTKNFYYKKYKESKESIQLDKMDLQTFTFLKGKLKQPDINYKK